LAFLSAARKVAVMAEDRIIFTGGRDFADVEMVEMLVNALPAHVTVVVGDAPGADYLVYKAAKDRGLKVEVHMADWKAHGRAAGPLRNQGMVDGGAYLCVAFEGGKGTADCVRRAKAAGIRVKEARSLTALWGQPISAECF
jgi:hypothetical protein